MNQFKKHEPATLNELALIESFIQRGILCAFNPVTRLLASVESCNFNGDGIQLNIDDYEEDLS